MMSDVQHATLETNGITVHYVSQGDGPLVDALRAAQPDT